MPAGVGGWESCTIRVEPTGMVSVLTGVSPHGQGNETTFAQIVADELGVSQHVCDIDNPTLDRRSTGHGSAIDP